MRSLLATASLLFSISAFGQSQSEELGRIQQQMQTDQLNHQLRMQQIENEMERTRAATQRLAEERQRREEAEKADAIQADQERRRDEAAKKASAEADAIRMQVHMSGVRVNNNMYSLAAAIALFAFFVTVIVRHNKEGTMRYGQKFGVVLVVTAALGAMVALVVSRDWVPELDVLQNVMLTLRIAFFENDGQSLYSKTYLVDIPTKFILLGFACLAAYGLLAYLDIAPAPGDRGKSAKSSESLS